LHFLRDTDEGLEIRAVPDDIQFQFGMGLQKAENGFQPLSGLEIPDESEPVLPGASGQGQGRKAEREGLGFFADPQSVEFSRYGIREEHDPPQPTYVKIQDRIIGFHQPAAGGIIIPNPVGELVPEPPSPKGISK
jgi:hypothetical protein